VTIPAIRGEIMGPYRHPFPDAAMSVPPDPKVALFHRQHQGITNNDLDQAVSTYAPDVHYEETTLGWDLFECADLSASLEDSVVCGDEGP
jgi:hypothetical protein